MGQVYHKNTFSTNEKQISAIFTPQDAIYGEVTARSKPRP